MLLEEVSPEDIYGVREISSGIWGGEDYLPKVFNRWLEEGGFYKYVKDGKIVALCKYTEQPDGVIWLQGLRVHADHQGLGIGSLVASELYSMVSSIEHRALRFMTDSTNAKSIHLAMKRGFEVKLKLYHLDHDVVDEHETTALQERDVNEVADFVSSSKEYGEYRGLYISNWTAYDMTSELIEREVEAGNCFTIRDNSDIIGTIFLNHHRRYGRTSVPFMAGSEELWTDLLSCAFKESSENGRGHLLLKTPDPEVKAVAESMGMTSAEYETVLVLEKTHEQVL